MMKLKIKKLHHDAQLPTYATDGAACFDLRALGVRDNAYFTGLAVEVPEGYALMIYSRSGHGFKHGVRLANCVGVIDSDYRGEIMVKLFYDNMFDPLVIEPGDRIAQAMLIPVPRVEFEEVNDLSATVRGAGGMGSTGNA